MEPSQQIQSDVVVLPNDSNVHEVTFEPSFQGLCLGGPYIGTAHIRYCPTGGLLIEFMSFEKWLQSTYVDHKLTGEQMCRIIFDKMTDLVGEVPLIVTLTGETVAHAPATMTISRGF